MDSLYDGFDINDTPTLASGAHFNVSDDTEDINRTMVGTSFNMNDTVRPMTSNQSAGYSSAARSKKKGNISGYKNKIDPLRRTAGSDDKGRREESLSERAEFLEKNVNKLLKRSICSAASGELDAALDLAQKCRKLDGEAVAFRKKHGLEDGIKSDLSLSVLFNVAHIYESKGLYTESLNLYNVMLQNKAIKMEVTCRLRVNMGNIYYAQKRYDSAVKMYRMALDELGDASWRLKLRIQRNIGNALIKMGELVDAMQAFESMVDGAWSSSGAAGDPQSMFNLLVAYYTLGDKEKMKKGFLQLLQCSASLLAIGGGRSSDEYGVYLLRRWSQWRHYMKQSVQLIGRAIADKFDGDEYSGYDWFLQHLSAMQQRMATECTASASDEEAAGGAAGATSGQQMVSEIMVQVQVSKGIEYLKDNRFHDAVAMLSALRRDGEGRNVHHNNLAFVHFVGSEYAESAELALSAVTADRYNAAALVNRANCLLVFGSVESAKEMYLEAIGVEADCVAAIYNLGVTAKKMGHFKDALAAFKKLHKMDEATSARMDPQILFQIGHCYQLLKQQPAAIEWFKTVHSVLPSDCYLLNELANLYKVHAKEETLIFHQFLDSYSIYKANLAVLSWLGVWYINHSLYEKAITVFHTAAQLQPEESKWRLMIASCHRRMSSFQTAIRIYQQLLDQQNDDSTDHQQQLTLKCLQYLAAITQQIDHPQAEHYQHRLQLYEQQQMEQRPPSPNTPTPPPATTTTLPRRREDAVAVGHRHAVDDEEDADDSWADVHLDDELLPS